jgi:Family of unknown function (DUF6069)
MLFAQEPKRHPTRSRIATVVLAPVVALGGWALIRLAGIDLTVSAGPGTVRAGDVFAAALVVALGAWGVVLLLERYTRSPGRWWPFIGSTALALSIIGPSYLADGASAAALIGLHAITAVVVITGFAATLSVACDPCADATSLPASG